MAAAAALVLIAVGLPWLLRETGPSIQEVSLSGPLIDVRGQEPIQMPLVPGGEAELRVVLGGPAWLAVVRFDPDQSFELVQSLVAVKVDRGESLHHFPLGQEVGPRGYLLLVSEQRLDADKAGALVSEAALRAQETALPFSEYLDLVVAELRAEPQLDAVHEIVNLE
ncbi:MAG: hypothetical protein AAF533_04670 [Acidobacteriota bacterium]